MAITFSTLPPEIHDSIAKSCEKNELINLCLTSKWMNEICVRVLYRSVDLQLDQDSFCSLTEDFYDDRLFNIREKQQQFVQTLLSRPEYGKYLRFFKGTLCIPTYSRINPGNRSRRWSGSEKERTAYEELWRALQSLTHIQSVDIGSRNGTAYCLMLLPEKQFPSNLFQSTTSVKLVGHTPYGLAKSILNAINPATLKHLCLDIVLDRKVREIRHQSVFRDEGQLIELIPFGNKSGLLTTLTGSCTALRTLILRRTGTSLKRHGLRLAEDKAHQANDKASYIEWASFIHSVQGTVEEFTFEQTEMGRNRSFARHTTSGFIRESSYRIMDKRFRRFILPAIVSGNWPCLTMMELLGVRGSEGLGGNAGLIKKLRAALGEDANIVVEGKSQYHDVLEELNCSRSHCSRKV